MRRSFTVRRTRRGGLKLCSFRKVLRWLLQSWVLILWQSTITVVVRVFVLLEEWMGIVSWFDILEWERNKKRAQLGEQEFKKIKVECMASEALQEAKRSRPEVVVVGQRANNTVRRIM